jgi:hypothetical protein
LSLGDTISFHEATYELDAPTFVGGGRVVSVVLTKVREIPEVDPEARVYWIEWQPPSNP